MFTLSNVLWNSSSWAAFKSSACCLASSIAFWLVSLIKASVSLTRLISFVSIWAAYLALIATLAASVKFNWFNSSVCASFKRDKLFAYWVVIASNPSVALASSNLRKDSLSAICASNSFLAWWYSYSHCSFFFYCDFIFYIFKSLLLCNYCNY